MNRFVGPARFLGATTAAVATVALLVGGGTAAGAGLPGLLVWDGHGFAVRPATIYYTGDGSGIIGRLPSGYRAASKRPGSLRWTVWNSTRAAGVGTVWGKSCVPDCAGSPFSSHRLTITATRVRHGVFTRMTLRYRDGGSSVTDRRCVVGAGAASGWSICGIP